MRASQRCNLKINVLKEGSWFRFTLQQKSRVSTLILNLSETVISGYVVMKLVKKKLMHMLNVHVQSCWVYLYSASYFMSQCMCADWTYPLECD